MSAPSELGVLTAPQVVEPAGRGARRRRLFNAQLVTGAVVLIILVAASVFAGLLAPDNPNAINPVASLLPLGSPGHWLGTDNLGRDQLSRMLFGGRITLIAGVGAGLAATVTGLALGLIAGYFGGWVDLVVARFLDVLVSFPFILLAILIVAFAGPSTLHALLAVAVGNVPFFARLIRGQVKTVAESEYIVAARAAGASTMRILWHHVLPNVLVYVVQGFFLNVGWLITQTSALSFLGLGTQPPTADWGTMLAQAQEFMATQPEVALVPGAAIVLAVVAFNLVGSGLRAWIEGQGAQSAI
jgi:peptide/nickel transport system permease protein